MRRAIVCIALSGCVSVTHQTTPRTIRDAAPTLLREGTAVIPVDETDGDSPSTTKLEPIRIDEPVRVGEQTMTVAELFADCPPDLDDSKRLAYPRCQLFQTDAIETSHRYRADKAKIILAGLAAGDVTCAAACGGRAGEAALAVGLTTVVVGGLAWYVHELFKQPNLKH